jgi:hypothetical protein
MAVLLVAAAAASVRPANLPTPQRAVQVRQLAGEATRVAAVEVDAVVAAARHRHPIPTAAESTALTMVA